MMTHSSIVRYVILALSMSLFVSGCASFSGTTSRTVVFQSYDLPNTLEANAVIRAVERAFARTLSKPPRIVEGKVPSPLPTMPAHFTVEDRLVHLDRLGTVSIPEVVCPENMALVQAVMADRSESSGLRSYIACIQAYAGGYRVSLVGRIMAVNGSSDGAVSATEAGPTPIPALLARIADALREQISEARLVAGFHAEEPGTPVWRTDDTTVVALGTATAERPIPLALPPALAAASPIAYRGEDAVSTLPLVCLAPKRKFAAVRAARGEGGIITLLDQGSIMAVAEPVDAAYFLVETEDGTAGWVNRADVTRLPCPIG